MARNPMRRGAAFSGGVRGVVVIAVLSGCRSLDAGFSRIGARQAVLNSCDVGNS
jgi:hypothetical protein